jgi:myo-inositol-1(or 4)-monophosphatase
MARSAILNVMVTAATKAGRGLVRDFNEVENLQVSRKGPGDFVSLADKKAETTIKTELLKARPGYSFIGEEGGAEEGTDGQHRWIVDPLDGTTNFLHGIPLFAVSIALERQGVLVAGVVYNPVMDELYVAERGGGAFLNDRRLRVAQRRDFDDCVIAVGLPNLGKGEHGRALRELGGVMLNAAAVRRCGSAALDLAWTASGRFDAYWENGLQSWDIAAGVLLVREAGGYVTDAKGGETMLETGSVVAGNERTHAELLGHLKRAASAG